ncbi:hypothetical protein [Aquimarina muelleri]|uniref:Uncharacterized protein n=1 Tax=Aquimarina muelleri TaxID=279356 RepID=A0A918JYT8_9FLAO|nr:hypothetical protein [Aquimarina muelleri]MCX2764098.1 hypothetical protein [Aquimarina muelleri]GGX22742.1 hypothetical protein GCM10007384_24940 [Aquimarina muelleri]
MKYIKNLIPVLFVLFCSYMPVVEKAGNNQETETITGVFDGYDGDTFSFKYTNEDGEEDVVIFPKISSEVDEKEDLSGDVYIGKTFNITYISEVETEIDEDGNEQEYVTRTIVALELVD